MTWVQAFHYCSEIGGKIPTPSSWEIWKEILKEQESETYFWTGMSKENLAITRRKSVL